MIVSRLKGAGHWKLNVGINTTDNNVQRRGLGSVHQNTLMRVLANNPMSTRGCCNVELTSTTLIQRRNNLVPSGKIICINSSKHNYHIKCMIPHKWISWRVIPNDHEVSQQTQNICIIFVQRRPTSKTLADVVVMLYRCFVFAGLSVIRQLVVPVLREKFMQIFSRAWCNSNWFGTK